METVSGVKERTTMIHRSLRPYYLMGSLTVILLIITAGGGVLDKSIYRPFLSELLVQFQFFQDLLSLFVAVLLVASMYLTSRSSWRAFILWAGLLVYVLYYYAFYGLGLVLTVYYPLYLALLGLATYSLIGMLTGVQLQAFHAVVTDRMPVRFICAVLGMTVLFVPIWFGMLVQDIAAQQAREVALVFPFDLAFLIPAIVFATAQLWCRRPLGFLLAGVLLVKATLSGILLTGGCLLQIAAGAPLVLEEFALYIFLALMGAFGLLRYLRALDDEAWQRRRDVRVPLPENG